MNLVLFGAGAAGRYTLKYLLERGVTPCAFADNDSSKEFVTLGEVTVPVYTPADAYRRFHDVEWVVCAISRPAATEIRAHIKALGVATKPLWECLPVHHGLPSVEVMGELLRLVADTESQRQLIDQYDFRKRPDYEAQRAPLPASEIYFPDFIAHLDDEHFVDCGASYGDTVEAFLARWNEYSIVSAIEPDGLNYGRLREANKNELWVSCHWSAVGDFDGRIPFVEAGDWSSHVGQLGDRTVRCSKLDTLLATGKPPTYIKMDIEGAEPEALWGARKILKEHKPVLAVCAYHTSSHLWEIPMLIHAIQPDYELFFRRYAEGAFEIVWYGVPPERVK